MALQSSISLKINQPITSEIAVGRRQLFQKAVNWSVNREGWTDFNAGVGAISVLATFNGQSDVLVDAAAIPEPRPTVVTAGYEFIKENAGNLIRVTGKVYLSGTYTNADLFGVGDPLNPALKISGGEASMAVPALDTWFDFDLVGQASLTPSAFTTFWFAAARSSDLVRSGGGTMYLSGLKFYQITGLL